MSISAERIVKARLSNFADRLPKYLQLEQHKKILSSLYFWELVQYIIKSKMLEEDDDN
jgi:hypothetical protein